LYLCWEEVEFFADVLQNFVVDIERGGWLARELEKCHGRYQKFLEFVSTDKLGEDRILVCS